MIPAIEKEYLKINKQLDALFESTSVLSHNQLNYKVSPKDWSILQVFQHLINAETHTNIYMRKKILAGDNLQDSGVGTSIKSGLMNALMHTGLKFKAPPVVNTDLDSVYSYEEQVQKWKEQREQIGVFLEDIDGPTSKKLLFKHGTGIRLNIIQMLKWMYAHVVRHSNQIEKIRRDSAFPKQKTVKDRRQLNSWL